MNERSRAHGPGSARFRPPSATAFPADDDLDICPECGRPRHELLFDSEDRLRSEPRSPRIATYVILLLVPLLVLTALLQPGDDGPIPDESAQPEGFAPPPSNVDGESSDGASTSDLTATGSGEASGFQLAFANAEGTVIVDLSSGAIKTSDISLDTPRLSYDEPFLLVSDENRTLAIPPAAPQNAFSLATNYRLVPTDTDGEYVFQPTGAPAIGSDTGGDNGGDNGGKNTAFIGQEADGTFGRRLTIPPGTRELPVPGLGLLVVAPDGTTFLTGFGEFKPFSERPVIAATPSHRLELRCRRALDCTTLLVDNATDRETKVPDGISSEWTTPVLSPDGRFIAALGPDGLTRHQVSDWSSTLLLDKVARMAWAPDSSFIALIEDASNAARIWLFFTDGRPADSVSLSDAVLVGPVESNLLVIP